jgi:hypothetical protein
MLAYKRTSENRVMTLFLFRERSVYFVQTDRDSTTIDVIFCCI